MLPCLKLVKICRLDGFDSQPRVLCDQQITIGDGEMRLDMSETSDEDVNENHSPADMDDDVDWDNSEDEKIFPSRMSEDTPAAL